jgi:hypothetical protein
LNESENPRSTTLRQQYSKVATFPMIRLNDYPKRKPEWEAQTQALRSSRGLASIALPKAALATERAEVCRMDTRGCKTKVENNVEIHRGTRQIVYGLNRK